jgi:hypothetical protein
MSGPVLINAPADQAVAIGEFDRHPVTGQHLPYQGIKHTHTHKHTQKKNAFYWHHRCFIELDCTF